VLRRWILRDALGRLRVEVVAHGCVRSENRAGCSGAAHRRAKDRVSPA